MHTYELTIIFEPSLKDEECEAIIKKLGIKAESQEVWGKRTLAYPIKKRREGIYYFLQTKAEASSVKELTHQMILEQKILRYLLIAPEKK